MKTPRLALFAFLALAASFANASSLPTWTVVEEGPRAWARVFFTVEKQSKTLRCRYNECKPEVKGISNLYTITPVGTATPIKVTRYKSVERSKLNPRYWTDGPWDHKVVMDVIDAKAQPYASELSHFKLDNTGAKLVVVQGTVKYPATTDIFQDQYNSYDQLKVAPPTKMIDDVVRPDAPATPPGTGEGPRTAPAARWWCDPKTGEKYSAARGRLGSILLASESAECKKTGAATPPPPVVVTPPPAETETSLALLDADETRWLTKKQAGDYARERAAAKDAAARKAADDKYRDLVEAQTRPEAQAAYKTARGLPVAEAAEKLKAAVGAVEMWGGKDVTAIVELFQAAASPATAKLLEIQLSKAESDALRKKPADWDAYIGPRAWARGAPGDGTAFDAAYFDPVALHLSVAAARKALGTTADPANPADPAAPTDPAKPVLDQVNLTPEQKKMLSPDELTKYEGQETAAAQPGASKETKEALYRLNAEYKELIKTREPYVKPTDAASFAKLKDWQKKRFCADLPSPSAVAEADKKAAFVGNLGTDANSALGKQSAQEGETPPATTPPATTPPATSKAWSKDESDEACKKFKETLATTPGNPGNSNGSGRTNQTAKVPGPDAVAVDEKKENKWVNKPLIQTALKGGLLGLLIGSLFGPLGLVLGPAIGAALFYGLQRRDEIKAEKAKIKPE